MNAFNLARKFGDDYEEEKKRTPNKVPTLTQVLRNNQQITPNCKSSNTLHVISDGSTLNQSRRSVPEDQLNMSSQNVSYEKPAVPNLLLNASRYA